MAIVDSGKIVTEEQGGSATTAAGVAAVLFLGVTAGIQMSDRGLHSILSQSIKQAFGVSDGVIGALHGIAGILIASALAVPLARLADRYSRKMVLLALIALWGILTAVCAISPNFPTFFIGRAASGVTEFAMIPIVYSLIPDLVSERHRVTANLVFAALMAVGASAGFYFGGNLLNVAQGYATPDFSPWRLTLLWLSFAAIPLLLVGLFIKDPPRQIIAARDDQTAESFLAFLHDNYREILLFLGTAGGLAVAVQAVVPMIAMAMEREFKVDLEQLGHALGQITLVTSLGSLLLAGVADRLLQRRFSIGSRPAIMAFGAAVAIPALIVFGLSKDDQQALTMIALFLAVTSLANALIPTMLQDILPAEFRARGFAVYSFVIAAFCAVGPVLSGSISDYVTGGLLTPAIALAGVPSLAIAVICGALATSERRSVTRNVATA